MTSHIETVEAHWIEARGEVGVRELASLAGVPQSLVDELIEFGALDETGHRAESVTLVRSVRRLRDDFELDGDGLAVAVSLLRRLRAVERELAELRARGGA